MTKFEKLINRHKVDINKVIKNGSYRTYRKWITGEIADPRISSLKLFIKDFKNQCSFNIEELCDCFTYGEEENEDFILTISSNWLPRRNLSIISQLIYTKYVDKKILVVNATPYGDLTKEFGVEDDDVLRIRELDISSITSVKQLKESIYRSKAPRIDFINLASKGHETIPLAEEEKDMVCTFRRILSDLEHYDNIIIACSNNHVSISRLLGAVANNCITFSDIFSKEYQHKVQMHHTVEGFNDRFIVLDALNEDRNGSCNHDESYLALAGKVLAESITRKLEE